MGPIGIMIRIDECLMVLLQVAVLALLFAVLAKLPGDPADSDGNTSPVWRKPDDSGQKQL